MKQPLTNWYEWKAAQCQKEVPRLAAKQETKCTGRMLCISSASSISCPSVSLLERTQLTCFNEEYWQSVRRNHIYHFYSAIRTNIIQTCLSAVAHYKSSDGAFWDRGCMSIFAGGQLDSCLPFQPCLLQAAPASVLPGPLQGKTVVYYWGCLVLFLMWITSSIRFPVSFTDSSIGRLGGTMGGSRDTGVKKSDWRQETFPAGFTA